MISYVISLQSRSFFNSMTIDLNLNDFADDKRHRDITKDRIYERNYLIAMRYET